MARPDQPCAWLLSVKKSVPAAAANIWLPEIVTAS